MGAGTGYPNGEGARADQFSGISEIESGQDTVSTPGTPVQLNGGTSISIPDAGSVVLRAKVAADTDFVYVSDEDVSSSAGFELGQGDMTPPLNVDDINVFHIDADTAGDGVSWIAETTGETADGSNGGGGNGGTTTTVLDDFDSYTSDSDLRSNYAAASTELQGFFLDTNNTIDDQNVGADSGGFDMAWDGSGGDTPRGDTYKWKTRSRSGESHPGVHLEVQNVNDPNEAGYVIRTDVRENAISLRAWDNGSVVENENIGVQTLEIDTIYRMEVDYSAASGGGARFECELFNEDDNDTSMGSGTVEFSTDHTNGVFGIAAGRGASDPDPDEIDTIERIS